MSSFPAGVDDQMRIRLAGEGEPSPNGGPPGDCYCFIHVEEHPLFHRDGQNLIVRLPISYSQAALGATVEVPTLDGREPLPIPRGTQSGDVFRLRGQGMPDPRRRGKGDLLVEVHRRSSQVADGQAGRIAARTGGGRAYQRQPASQEVF